MQNKYFYKSQSFLYNVLVTFKHFFKFANVKMFSVIAVLEYFHLLEALKDSKIPYLFLTDLVSIEFHRSLYFL